MIRKSLILLGGIALGVSVGYWGFVASYTLAQTDPDLLVVRIRQNPACDVDFEEVNLRLNGGIAGSTTPDKIRWCSRSSSSKYFIHYAVSPFGSAINDFPGNQTTVGNLECSAIQTPNQTANTYTYEIRYDQPTGVKCSDPKVILK